MTFASKFEQERHMNMKHMKHIYYQKCNVTFRGIHELENHMYTVHTESTSNV